MRLSFAGVTALAGSVLLHGVGLMIAPQTTQAPLAGGEAVTPPLLGDSFATLSQGMAHAVTSTQAASAAPSAQALSAVVPVLPEGILPVAALTAVAPLAPEPAQAAALTKTAPATVHAEAAAPATAPTKPASPSPQQLQPTPEPPAKKTEKPRAPVAQGAQAPAHKGTASGQTSGTTARAQGQKQAQGDAGRAATASYGSAVMRKLSGIRKRTTNFPGTAVISFSIAANGQLGSVRVSRSSGSAELDALGVDHVRRAAPFPAPPKGADARFSVEFKGR